MEKELKVRDWQVAYEAGRFDVCSTKVQIEAGWYDWFCRDESLRAKTRKLGKLVLKVKDGGKVNLDNNYVWFKNNCPMVGPLYDDFRFADIETGDTLITISVGDKRDDALYVVWADKNGFKEPVFKAANSKALIEWLNTPWGN